MAGLTSLCGASLGNEARRFWMALAGGIANAPFTTGGATTSPEAIATCGSKCVATTGTPAVATGPGAVGIGPAGCQSSCLTFTAVLQAHPRQEHTDSVQAVDELMYTAGS